MTSLTLALLMIAGMALPSVGSDRAIPSNAEVRALVAMVNRHRAEIGCRPLIWDERLAGVAREHSEDMARRGYFSHVDPRGRSPFDRLDRADISYHAAAENIAFGQTSARDVFGDWMRSRGHRANLENCVYTRHGIGVYRNRWTHLFVRE